MMPNSFNIASGERGECFKLPSVPTVQHMIVVLSKFRGIISLDKVLVLQVKINAFRGLNFGMLQDALKLMFFLSFKDPNIGNYV